jgi:acetyl CoA:N6-hydroxylysine acetyl transferase
MSANLSSADGNRIFPVGAGVPMLVVRDEAGLSVVADGMVLLALRIEEPRKLLTVLRGSDDTRSILDAISAAAEALFGWFPELDKLVIDVAERQSAASLLLSSGLAVTLDDALTILPELAMQRRANWLADAMRPPQPQLHVMTDGKRHPRRPTKPAGLVYSRFIPWLSEAVSFRVANLDDDLPLLHGWLNDPRVDVFWNEAGDLEKHRNYLSGILADPHMLPLIGCFGEVPFGYFELYWAKENRIAPFYDADDYDRGWHVIVGEDAYRGRGYITAWLPSLMHYMFLDDCRTQRIVGEPAAAHVQQLRNLELAGFAKIKNFDFPHKRATLVMLLRERFFGDRLWQPMATART